MGNGITYTIPRFQRDYTWTEEEWDDLWLDILDTIQEGGEPAHYMGYLVLQSIDEKTYAVIDGQQRLTTLSIIVIAVLKQLKRLVDNGIDAESNTVRMEQFQRSYIGYVDPITLVSRPKLTLNRNADSYYQTYIVPMTKLPQRKLRASEHQLRKAFEWFDRKVTDYLRSSSGLGGAVLATLVERMSDRLFFTVISVTNELNAYKVFETLNARGVRLSATDLLKNYLYSVMHKGSAEEREVASFESIWKGIVGKLGGEDFPDFLRIYWTSRRGKTRQADLFRSISREVIDRAGAFSLIRGLNEDVDIYLSLVDPSTSAWDQESKRHAQLLRAFSVRQPYPLLLAAHRRFNEEGFAKILKACVVISLRFNVIGGLGVSEQESVYNRTAVGIHSGAMSTPSEVIESLSPIYLSDKVFKDFFAEKRISTDSARNNKVVRYLLCALEKQQAGLDLKYESNAYTIEHVIPQNPECNWPHFNDDQVDLMADRLGNLTLLETNINRTIGNQSFREKRGAYARSNVKLTRSLADHHEEWTPESIQSRQLSLANVATAIWRIDQLAR